MSTARWLGAIAAALILILFLYLIRPTDTSDPSYLLFFALVLLGWAGLLIRMRQRIVRVVKEGELGVIARGGRFCDIARSGPVILIPFIETLRTLPLSEQFHQSHEAHVLTFEGIPIGVKMLVRYKLQKPTKEVARQAAFKVTDWQDAVRTQAVATLHRAVGSQRVDDLLRTWTQLGETIKATLQPTADEWGVEILNVQLFELRMPSTIGSALEDQRKAAIEVRAVDYRASAQAERLRQISECLRKAGVPEEVLADALQTERYIQALESMSEKPSTHTILPADFLRRLVAPGGQESGERMQTGGAKRKEPHPGQEAPTPSQPDKDSQ